MIAEELRQLRVEVQRLVEDDLGNAEVIDNDPADDFAPCNLIDTWAAAARFNYPQDTVRKWCRQGCGKRVGGRWLVSIAKVRRRIDGGA